MGKQNKEIATAQDMVYGLKFDTQPLDISVCQSTVHSKYLNIAVLTNNTMLFKKDEDEQDYNVITLYGACKEPRYEEDTSNDYIPRNLVVDLICPISASDIYLILEKINGKEFTNNELVKVEIDKVLLSDENLLIYATVVYFNKVVTYQFMISLSDLEMNYHIYNTTIVQEYDNEEIVEKVTSVSCSSDLSTISLILGKNYHIVLRRKDELDDIGNIESTTFVSSLKNYTRFTNGEDKRTLYSTVNKEGNRVVISDRDESVRLRNNSNVTNLGTINSLVYDSKKDKWIIEDRFFEVNVNIRNIGEHVDINSNGDRLVTTCVYNPINTETTKEVIYLLNRDVKGRWKRIARGIIGDDIINISLLNDSNILLAETAVKVGEDKTIKKLNCLIREGDSLANNELVDNEGIYRQFLSSDKHEYVGFTKFRSPVWDCVVLAKNVVTDKYHLFTLKPVIVNKYSQEELKELEATV